MSKATDAITEYLSVGGLFNPETLNQTQHEAVRDTLMAARDEILLLEQRCGDLAAENMGLRNQLSQLEQELEELDRGHREQGRLT